MRWTRIISVDVFGVLTGPPTASRPDQTPSYRQGLRPGYLKGRKTPQSALIAAYREETHRLLYRRRIALGKATLVPVGIGRRGGAGGVEPGDLLGGQVPADGAEVLAQLLLVAGADDDVGHASGRCSSQLSAICGTVLPVSLATSSRASTTR